ncbi:hypothetical protein GCM10009841_27880 [Microlunatus panaciterrae]|uniref:Glycosyl transferase family 2 n=1 Tax=Microlunatus panaciterrae TaxID=400768 RepID=A0ABS2RJ17_9ACTN|nr:hypothetical protein [Microlunatus panaciterrae]MBM7798517.1 hypothetical protein [Microlunatus panaciterrae]
MSSPALPDWAVIRTGRSGYRWLRKKSKRALSHVWLAALKVRNRHSSATVTGDADVVVSLTSYGRRVQSVAYAIESIASGRLKPRRLILWLDNQAVFDSRPASLRRLEQRGLEIRMAQNYGPHTKYFPYVQSEAEHRLPLVTADDDVLYPPNWLSRLYRAASARPDLVSCYRAARILTSGQALAPYNSWPMCKTTLPGPDLLATGVSGVLYPVRMLAELARRGAAFMDVCPAADDIWLHWVALRAGIPVRQISRTPVHFPVIPGTQEQTLVASNVGQGGNDKWISNLYTPDDVALLSGLSHTP